MGWGFRKSFNLGPLRINTSKSGTELPLRHYLWGVPSRTILGFR